MHGFFFVKSLPSNWIRIAERKKSRRIKRFIDKDFLNFLRQKDCRDDFDAHGIELASSVP